MQKELADYDYDALEAARDKVIGAYVGFGDAVIELEKIKSVMDVVGALDNLHTVLVDIDEQDRVGEDKKLYDLVMGHLNAIINEIC
jgi:hypothetical protein